MLLKTMTGCSLCRENKGSTVPLPESSKLGKYIFSMCLLQVPVTVVSVSAIPKTGGCLESTANATTESVTNTMASFAQVNHTLWN